MTLFEYIAIASSIILSFAVVRLLDTLPHAFEASRRSWPHCGFVLVVLWACAQFWWIGWALHSASTWTYPRFLLYLLIPATLYSLARTLSSSDPSAVASFSAYLDDVHRRFFSLFCAYLVLLTALSLVFFGVSLGDPLRLFQLVGIGLAASGIFVAAPRYHGLLAAIFLAQLGVATFGLFTPPGGGFVAP